MMGQQGRDDYMGKELDKSNWYYDIGRLYPKLDYDEMNQMIREKIREGEDNKAFDAT